MEHNYQPLLVVLGTIVRHFLTIVAGWLFAYGVTQEQADAAIDASVAIVLSLVTTAIALAWSYISKRNAFETPTENQ